MAVPSIQFSMSLSQFDKLSFNKPKVRKRLDKNTYYYLKYQGMNIRKSARRAVRQGSGTAPDPGPETSSGRGLAIIRYGVLTYDNSVIVGPVGFESQPWKEKTVPEVLETGGFVTAKSPWHRPQATHIAAHPYMQPARDKNLTRDRRQKVWEAANRKSGA